MRFLALAIVALGVTPALRQHVVVQKDKQFTTTQLRVAVGDSVRFVNDDVVTHNVFSSTEGFRFNLKRQPPGTAASVSFMTRGTAQIRCVIHPGMKLTVVVE